MLIGYTTAHNSEMVTYSDRGIKSGVKQLDTTVKKGAATHSHLQRTSCCSREQEQLLACAAQ